MNKAYKWIVLGILLLIFTSFFARNIQSDLPLIFKKDLLAHDESSNSVVAANLTRKFFPPMVRINPLNPVQGNWMEGPFWQHIPPLFVYVPYIFFKLDGQVTIEVKRLAFAFVELLTGLALISGIFLFSESLLLTLAATIAAWLWINTPFTRALVTGYAFGVSDIVLALTIVLSFIGILWYLKPERPARVVTPTWKLVIIGILVALPIMAKNILGAIPAATFFGLLIYDQRKLNKQFWSAALAFAAALVVYYLPLYIASPVTFKNEILLAFFHFQNLEGWARPTFYYLTNYLPQLYLMHWFSVYCLGIIAAGLILWKWKMMRQSKIILGLSGLWFIWNLIAISLVKSKVPNFIFQTYLLSLLTIVTALVILFKSQGLDLTIERLLNKKLSVHILGVVLLFAIIFTGQSVYALGVSFHRERKKPYAYTTEHEKFYHTAEILRQQGIGTSDLIIVHVSDNDCWFRYYPLFLTGTESKTLLEMSFGYSADRIKEQYQSLIFILNKSEATQGGFVGTRTELPDYSEVSYDLTKLNSAQIQTIVDSYVHADQAEITQNVLRIKKDTTTCQWLVPDSILNAP